MKIQIMILSLLAGLFMLFSASSQAQSTDIGDEIQAQPEAEDMLMLPLRRPRPQPQTMYRCCSKPSTSGAMFCNTGPDKVFSLDRAIGMCESNYGKGICVSGCRRIVSASLSQGNEIGEAELLSGAAEAN